MIIENKAVHPTITVYCMKVGLLLGSQLLIDEEREEGGGGRMSVQLIIIAIHI